MVMHTILPRGPWKILLQSTSDPMQRQCCRRLMGSGPRVDPKIASCGRGRSRNRSAEELALLNSCGLLSTFGQGLPGFRIDPRLRYLPALRSVCRGASRTEYEQARQISTVVHEHITSYQTFAFHIFRYSHVKRHGECSWRVYGS